MAKKKISIDNDHPEAIERNTKVKSAEDEDKKFVDDIIAKVQKDINDRQTRRDKLNRWYEKRYGIRPQVLNFPWPGAPNIHIFLVDEKIRRLKPNYINLVFEGDPVATFQAIGRTPLENAQNAEILMNHLIKYRMNQYPGLNFFKAISLVTDRMLEKGLGWAKIVWSKINSRVSRSIDLNKLSPETLQVLAQPNLTDAILTDLILRQTELKSNKKEDRLEVEKIIKQIRAGEKVIKYKETIVRYNAPIVAPLDDPDIIFPVFITHIQTSPRLCIKIKYTENELNKDFKSGKYENVPELLKKLKKDNSDSAAQSDIIVVNPNDTQVLEDTKDTREGINMPRKRSELIEVWEIYTWKDIDGDGIDEKIVLTVEPTTGIKLREIAFPYDHDKWPVVGFPYEYNDDRILSPRGIPELLDNYQTELTLQENCKLARMRLSNTLMLKYRIGAVNPKQIRYIPTQGIGVHRMDDIQEMQMSNTDASYDNEMSKLRSLAGVYIGQPDTDLGDFAKGGGERRTAFEVNEAAALGRQIFSFDIRLFKDSLSQMYDQIFELWVQYGPLQDEIKITGGIFEEVEGPDGQMEQKLVTTKKLKKSDIVGNFVIVPSSDYSMLSRTFEQQRAFAELELSLKDTSGAIDKYNALQDYFLKIDPKGAQRKLRSRSEFEKIQRQQFEAQQQAIQDKKEIAGRPTATQAAVKMGNPATTAVGSSNIANQGT